MNKRPTEPAPNATSRRKPMPPISSGATGSRTPKEEAEKKAMEKKYPFNKYAKGGKTMKKSDKAGRALVKKSADTMGRAMMAKGGKCYAKGGSVSARADGIAQKGKTKGKVL